MGNRHNGRMSKQVQTSMGEIPHRDRDGSFDPQAVRKREKILADSLADRIMGLFPETVYVTFPYGHHQRRRL